MEYGTAIKVAENATLRWSSSKIFNDPFDVPLDILDGFDFESVNQAFLTRLIKLLKNPDELDLSQFGDDFGTFFHLLKCGEQSSRERLIECILSSPQAFTGHIGEGLFDEIRNAWKCMYSEKRILCLSKVWNSAAMWHHYAKGHNGCVFEFACNEENDSAWLAAEPVKYIDGDLQINTADGFVDALLEGGAAGIAKQIHDEYTYTKTLDWKYEEEYRVSTFKRPQDTGDYTDYEFAEEDLSAVIMGEKMEPEARSRVVDLISSKYPHTVIWVAYKEGGRHLKKRLHC
ncbi:DUF2971 domain-containing protein [Persicirhabdus sediminis]|uniref:DUF2971 domain-containing protein n=2 Tax=Persicirhabdus sediminis TaxID=454144 RepID=A0A8J7MEL6_9BACT|nr:DUF2971 domain-containing protein [Persicirhabdus sediminis]